MNTGFDIEMLNLELASIENIDMSEFDFEFDFDADDEPVEIVEDEVPDVDDAEPITKLGDIWQLGRHRLMCGDSTDKATVEKLMDGNKADMVFTDPPYGYEYQSNFREKTEKFDVLMNDDKILDFMPQIKEVCDGFVFVCTSWKVLDKWLSLFNKYYELSNMIIWHKPGGGLGDLKHTFLTDYEIILCSNNGKEITGKRLGCVWRIGRDSVNDYVHATQKPVELSATAIENTTKTNDIVLDCFGGSGSTLIACEQLDRTCYMMELDPKYCDVIIKRWETLTGEKAELISR
jgi:DNA modification methylase